MREPCGQVAVHEGVRAADRGALRPALRGGALGQVGGEHAARRVEQVHRAAGEDQGEVGDVEDPDKP
eukprot:8225307-Pyramimonas_sp.AAC.1